MSEIIEVAQAAYYHGRAIKQGIITAALIIAIAMLGCAVIDYYTFREDPGYYETEEEVSTPFVISGPYLSTSSYVSSHGPGASSGG